MATDRRVVVGKVSDFGTRSEAPKGMPKWVPYVAIAALIVIAFVIWSGQRNNDKSSASTQAAAASSAPTDSNSDNMFGKNKSENSNTPAIGQATGNDGSPTHAADQSPPTGD